MPTIPAELYRFPDRGGGIFMVVFLGLWCKRTARWSPKPQISDHTRTDLLWLFGVIGNTPDSDSGITGSNPVRAALGH